MLKEKVYKSIDKVLADELHSASYYTEQMKEDLADKITHLFNDNDSPLYHMDKVDALTQIEMINEHLQHNVKLSLTYNNAYKMAQEQNINFEDMKELLKYRTAAAALCEGESICTGYAEALRIILDTLDIKAKTYLALTPDPRPTAPLPFKPFFHYLTVATINSDDGRAINIVLDPERQSKKGPSFRHYMHSVKIIETPPKEFVTAPVGRGGLGIAYTKCKDLRLKDVNEMGKVLPEVLKEERGRSMTAAQDILSGTGTCETPNGTGAEHNISH